MAVPESGTTCSRCGTSWWEIPDRCPGCGGRVRVVVSVGPFGVDAGGYADALLAAGVCVPTRDPRDLAAQLRAGTIRIGSAVPKHARGARERLASAAIPHHVAISTWEGQPSPLSVARPKPAPSRRTGRRLEAEGLMQGSKTVLPVELTHLLKRAAASPRPQGRPARRRRLLPSLSSSSAVKALGSKSPSRRVARVYVRLLLGSAVAASVMAASLCHPRAQHDAPPPGAR